MEEWDDLVGEVLGDDPDNDKLRESIEDHFINQIRNHSKKFEIDLHAYDAAPIGEAPHNLETMEDAVRNYIERLELGENKRLRKEGKTTPKGPKPAMPGKCGEGGYNDNYNNTYNDNYNDIDNDNYNDHDNYNYTGGK